MKMEKITIVNLEAKPTQSNKIRWIAVDDLGREFSVWDKDIADNIMKNLNKPAYVSIKVSGNYSNIQTFEPITGEKEQMAEMKEVQHAMEVVNVVNTVTTSGSIGQEKPVKPLLSAMEEKNFSIVSQVVVKRASDYAIMKINNAENLNRDSTQTYEEHVTHATNVLTGAYHLAFNNLQTGE